MSDHIHAKQPAKSVEPSSPTTPEKIPDYQNTPDAEMLQSKHFATGAITPQIVSNLQRTHGNHFTKQYVQQHRPVPQRQPNTTSPEALFPVLKTSKPHSTAIPQRQPEHFESEKIASSSQHSERFPAAQRTVAQHVVGQWLNTVQKSGVAGIYRANTSPSSATNRGPVGTAVGAIAGGILGGIGGALLGGVPGAIIGGIGGCLAGGAIGNAIGNAVGGGAAAPTSIVPTSIASTVINGNSASLGPTTYGFIFKHTLNTNTGGTITPDVMVAEHVTLGRDDFNTGWGGVPLGSLTWGPGGTAPLYGNDMYDNITTPGVNVTNFMPSPPKPGLPAIMETPQTLHYKIGTGNWIQFASVPMVLTLRPASTGGYEVETAINGVGRAQPYTGPTP